MIIMQVMVIRVMVYQQVPKCEISHLGLYKAKTVLPNHIIVINVIIDTKCEDNAN